MLLHQGDLPSLKLGSSKREVWHGPSGSFYSFQWFLRAQIAEGTGWWGRGQAKLLVNTLAVVPRDLNPTQPLTPSQPWASHWSSLLPPCTSLFSLPLLHSVSGLQSLKMKESLDIWIFVQCIAQKGLHLSRGLQMMQCS